MGSSAHIAVKKIEGVTAQSMGTYHNEVIKVSSQEAGQNNAGRSQKEECLPCLGRRGQPGAYHGLGSGETRRQLGSRRISGLTASRMATPLASRIS